MGIKYSLSASYDKELIKKTRISNLTQTARFWNNIQHSQNIRKANSLLGRKKGMNGIAKLG